MKRSMTTIAALCALGLSAACNEQATTESERADASIRFVNLTEAPLTLARNGSVPSGFGNVGFGAPTGCTTVQALSPGIQISNAAGVISTYSPTFLGGGRYVIIAYLMPSGATQYYTLNSSGSPPSGQAAVRVVNLAHDAPPLDVHVTASGAQMGTPNATGLAFNNQSPFIAVQGGTHQVRLTAAGSQTIVHDVGSHPFTAGSTFVVLIAPAVPGSSALRTLVVQSCS